MSTRTDKPKYRGTFKNQVCEQSITQEKLIKYKDKNDNWRYRKIVKYAPYKWIWNGNDWIPEEHLLKKANTVEEWLAQGNKIKRIG
jgi:hypothetical protein